MTHWRGGLAGVLTITIIRTMTETTTAQLIIVMIIMMCFLISPVMNHNHFDPLRWREKRKCVVFIDNNTKSQETFSDWDSRPLFHSAKNIYNRTMTPRRNEVQHELLFPIIHYTDTHLPDGFLWKVTDPLISVQAVVFSSMWTVSVYMETNGIC